VGLEKEFVMATYILLGILTDDGAESLRTNPSWLLDLEKKLQGKDVRVTAQYAVLGPYDLVFLIEAPDNRSVVRVSAELTLQGSLKVTTMPALPIDEFLETLT
jgi:uncharacterized protein with GYD domain